MNDRGHVPPESNSNYGATTQPLLCERPYTPRALYGPEHSVTADSEDALHERIRQLEALLLEAYEMRPLWTNELADRIGSALGGA